MKVYISGPFKRKNEVRDIMAKLQEKGFEVALDWTKHLSIFPYENNLELAEEYTTDDIDAAGSSDVFIMIPDSEGGSGQFTELGAAIFSEKVKRIFIIGKNNKRSMMFFHPKVERLESIEQMFDSIK